VLRVGGAYSSPALAALDSAAGSGLALRLQFAALSLLPGSQPPLCEHVFVTSQGHPYARFRHALATGNARIAESAARDLYTVSLGDALTLCLLYRDDTERYERAAARWIARLIAERPKIRLSEIELAAAGFREAIHTQRGVDAATRPGRGGAGDGRVSRAWLLKKASYARPSP
jgi:hypothetical protein